MKSSKKEGISLKLSYEGSPDKKTPIGVYVFDQRGTFKEMAAVKGDSVKLKSSARELSHGKLFVAPVSKEHKGSKETPEIRDLIARKAYQPTLRAIDNNLIEINPIPEFNWRDWCWLSCRVIGKVVKSIDVNGQQVDMPVCHARVHICEVDKLQLILPTIPDDVLIDLRDLVVNFPPEPIPDPIPDPIPIPRPQPDPLPFFRSNIQKLETIDAKSNLTPPSDELKKIFASGSVNQTRMAIVQNFHLLHPFLCYYPYFWKYFYRCDELKVVTTDSQGRFDTTIYYPCFGDKPDLYFWVEYCIEDVWTTVYKPSKPCNTYWNYICGSEVTIRLTDPRVDVCGELDTAGGSSSVEIVKIGNSGYTSHIQQNNGASIAVQGANLRTVGLTNLSSYGPFRRPFGGNLRMRVKFGSAFPGSGGINHYRWSYRKVAEANLNPIAPVEDWKVINTPTSIFYYEEHGANFHKKAYPLGPVPNVGETIFKIPPRYAADIDIPNPGNLVRTWALQEWDSAIFNSFINGVSDLQRSNDAGLYEFKFELIKLVGGNVQVAVVDKDTFQMPEYVLSPYTTKDAPDINLIQAPGNKASAFVMKVRIDNNKCQADIKPVSVDGAEANTCGFVEYDNKATDKANLSFQAYHPNNLATLTYRVRKGTEKNPITGQPVYRAYTTGMVINDTAQGYEKGAGSIFSKDVNVNSLLGNCDEAAFGAYLRVDALATDGNTTELGYDAASLAGFALKESQD